MKFEVSAGAVVFHDTKYLILKYTTHWGFVKGHIEKGETPEQTLLRELKEETGITDAEIIPGFKEIIGYYFRENGNLVSKKVIFFLVKSNTTNVKLSYEHEDYAWLSYEDALKRLSFENTRYVLRKAHQFLEKLKKQRK